MNPIAEAVEQVRARIEWAARAAGRDPGEVTIVAATKTVEPGRIRLALEAGITDAGENRAQELLAKRDALADRAVRWHFIGTLQRNKVADVVGAVSLIHSVDSVRLAEAISRRAEATGEQVRVLLQVNTTGEPTKHGVSVEEAPAVANAVRALPHIALDGLMTIGQLGAAGDARRAFASLRGLADRLGLRELSMGMSGDFEQAVAEGATIVRLGTALFGERPHADATQAGEQGTNG